MIVHQLLPHVFLFLTLQLALIFPSAPVFVAGLGLIFIPVTYPGESESVQRVTSEIFPMFLLVLSHPTV